MARTLAKNLERAGHAVEHAPHGEAALARLGEASFDIVLTDLKMPVMDGMALLRAMHERRLPPAVVVLTGYGTIESAVEAMKLGAADYLIKDARPQEILFTIERVLKLDALKRENVRLRGEIGRLHGFGELIGEGAPMKGIYRVINTVAGNKSTVLVSGESGTGQELVARTIHERGALAAHPFVAINCAGLSETLLDSQLFGHRRGAFTGAVHAPRRWPKSWLSSSVSESPAQLMATKGWAASAPRSWMVRATSSFPVPLSPLTRTVLLFPATVLMTR